MGCGTYSDLAKVKALLKESELKAAASGQYAEAQRWKEAGDRIASLPDRSDDVDIARRKVARLRLRLLAWVNSINVFLMSQSSPFYTSTPSANFLVDLIDQFEAEAESIASDDLPSVLDGIKVENRMDRKFAVQVKGLRFSERM